MKSEIIKKAFELFMERGFENVSVNDIVEALGISKGGFYHHFKSKDELLEEIAVIHSDRMFGVLNGVDITQFNKLSELINCYYVKLIAAKSEHIKTRVQMEEKLSAPYNIKLLMKIKGIMDKKTTAFYFDVFKSFDIKYPLEVAETWADMNFKINGLVHKAATRKDFMDEETLKRKLEFYEKLFGHLIGEEGSIELAGPMMEYVANCKAILGGINND